MSCINTGKLVTKITLDETLISDVPFLRCLEFLYTGIVELEANSTLLDETMKVAELFNLPELQTICENAKKGDEFIPINSTIGTWLKDRKREIAKQLFLYQPLFSDVRLMVEGKIIHAHKVVFLARCDVLSAMFKGGFVEADRSEVRGLRGGRGGDIGVSLLRASLCNYSNKSAHPEMIRIHLMLISTYLLHKLC